MVKRIRREKLTAICNSCGETVKEYFSARRGLGWNCIDCGYLTTEQVNSIAQLEAPTYSDGTPVRWLPEPKVARGRPQVVSKEGEA